MPAHIILTVPASATGASSLPALLAEWRQTGLIADAFLLTSAQSKESGFNSVAVLQFPDQTAVDRWQVKGAPSIGQGVITTKVDTLARGETFPRDSTKAIFMVAQYDVLASPDKYKEYVKQHLAPEMEGFRTRRVLTSYFLFAARDRKAAPWHSLLVLEYRDSVALERRDEVAGEVRKELASNATWTSSTDMNQVISKERSRAEAEWELLPAPALSDLPS
jgi:hypothetical protein